MRGNTLLAALLVCAPAVRADNLDIVTAARQQVGVTVVYDGGYQPLRYPGGDVPTERGVCTDVIVGALRKARTLDLQKVMHEDIVAHRDAYLHQRRWGNARPDSNIDHRRVPKQLAWFGRKGWSRAIGAGPADYLPGDIVAWNLGRGILHVGFAPNSIAMAAPSDKDAAMARCGSAICHCSRAGADAMPPCRRCPTSTTWTWFVSATRESRGMAC
jgi:uncharacterized protein YijF (DUF1287 family)